MLTDEQKETVYNHYCMSFDIDIAALRSGLSGDEVVELKDDSDFMFRLQLEDAEVKTDIMTSLRSLIESDNENIKLRATLELGTVLYRKRFKTTNQMPIESTDKPTKITLVGVS